MDEAIEGRKLARDPFNFENDIVKVCIGVAVEADVFGS